MKNGTADMASVAERIIASLATGVICLDGDGKIIQLNSTAETMLDVRAEEVCGKRVDMLPLRTAIYRVLSENCRETPVEMSINGSVVTAEVQRTIAQGRDRIRDGVKISAMANAALEQIAEGTAEASQMVQKIATSTVEQAAASKLITEESEKNLHRLQQFNVAVQEQKRGIGLIVTALEKMRSFSGLITNSTEEQSRGNRLYLKSVMEDNDRVKQLKETAVQQIMMGDVLLNYVTEASSLHDANSRLAKDMLEKVQIIAILTGRLHNELAVFAGKGAQ